MPSDQLVTASHVLRSFLELQRRRSRRVLSELETLEPDLAEYVIENLTQLHHHLARHGLSHRELRRVYALAESTLLVSLMALRRGFQGLLGQGDDGDVKPELPGAQHPPPHSDTQP
jgi:hypothetical protein